MLIGQGYTMKQAMDEVKMVVEGVYSAKAAIALAKNTGRYADHRGSQLCAF